MSDNENKPSVNVPQDGNADSAEPFSASAEVDRILSDILGSDGSYQETYKTMFTRYTGMPATPATSRRRQAEGDISPREDAAAPFSRERDASQREYTRRDDAASRRYDRDAVDERDSRRYDRDARDERDSRRYDRDAVDERDSRRYDRDARDERDSRRYDRDAVDERTTRSRDGELSYRERYIRIYGAPAPRRSPAPQDYPPYNGRFPSDSRRRTDVNRLPSDVDRLFDDIQREAQRSGVSPDGVKYPTLGNRSGERVIYDADLEELAQREAADALQRRIRDPGEERARQRSYSDSDFVAGGMNLSRSGRTDIPRGGVSSLIDPLTQDDSLYEPSAQQRQAKKGTRDERRKTDGEDEKKPFFSQGFPVSPADKAGTANGETTFTYEEHDAVLDSFSADYSAQTRREELWKQPVEKADRRKKKGRAKREEKGKTDASQQPVPVQPQPEEKRTPQPEEKRTPQQHGSSEQPAPESHRPAEHAVFPTDDIDLQDIAGSVFEEKSVYIPSGDSRDDRASAERTSTADKSEPDVVVPKTHAGDFDSQPVSPVTDDDENSFFGEENFENPSFDDGGVSEPVQEDKPLFDLGMFDEDNASEFVFPENFGKEKKTFKTRFKKFLKNNFPNKDDSKLNVLRKIVMDVSFVALICAVIYLGVYYVRYREHIAEGNELESIAGEYNTEYRQEELEALWENIHAQYPDVVFPEGMNIKFAKLFAVNQDVAGWLTVPGKQISTVLVKTNNNSYYLNRDYFGNTSRYGNPYVDYRCSIAKGNLSKSTIVYGHNTHDGLVFASLLDYMEIEGYKSSPIIELDTLYDTTYWKVFGVMLTNANPSEDNGHTFEYLYSDYGSDEAFLRVVEGIRQRSMIHTDIEVEAADNMLLLYTCYNNIFKNGRLVIAARQVREGESKDVDTSTAYFNYNARYPQAYYSALRQDNPYSDADDYAELTNPPEEQPEVTTVPAETAPAEGTTAVSGTENVTQASESTVAAGQSETSTAVTG